VSDTLLEIVGTALGQACAQIETMVTTKFAVLDARVRELQDKLEALERELRAG
jgi:hypothetical protein